MFLLKREDGQGLAEYALLLALIAIIVFVIVGVFGQQLVLLYQDIVTCLPDPNPSACFSS